MYLKILLAYDGSSNTDAALRQAIDLADVCKAELHLIGIANTATGSTAYAEPYASDFLMSEKVHIENALKSALSKIKSKGLKGSTILREGSPATQISEFAQVMEADLVVIGHTDKGFLARWFEGSVGADLVRNLPCSLLIATDR